MSYEDAAVLPLSVLRNINMQVQRRNLMSSQLITFAFFAQKSIFDLGVSSNRVHIVCLHVVRYIPVISEGKGRPRQRGISELNAG